MTEEVSGKISTILVRRLTSLLFITGQHTKWLFAIYSNFAETERAYISLRTRQGLAASKAKGKTSGRPQSRRNRERG